MELAPQERTAVAAISAPEASTISAALILSGDAMERIFKFAEVMARGIATVPKHLQGNSADCLAVTMQATQWGLNPFAVAQKTHLTQSGALGYESQLISAVITSSDAVTGQPEYEYFGDWDKILGKVEERKSEKTNGKYYVATYTKADEVGLGVICRLTLRGESAPREMKVLMTQCYPRFSTQWATDPKQQIAYVAIRKWSRLYAPGLILGVKAPDEDDIQEPPREMGNVEIVESQEASDDLKAQARKAAEGGNVSFRRWFKTISEADRTKLSPMRPELEAIWTKADQARTVTDVAQSPAAAPAPTQAQPTATPAAQAPAQDQPQVTFEWVLAKMNQAKNEDALNVAADWMGELNDPEERRKLSARYDERLAEINSKA